VLPENRDLTRFAQKNAGRAKRAVWIRLQRGLPVLSLLLRTSQVLMLFLSGRYTTRKDNPLKKMQSLMAIAGKITRIFLRNAEERNGIRSIDCDERSEQSSSGVNRCAAPLGGRLEGSVAPTTKVIPYSWLLSTESVHAKECCAEAMGIPADGSDVSAAYTLGLDPVNEHS